SSYRPARHQPLVCFPTRRSSDLANETGSSSEAIQVLKDLRARAGIEPGVDGMYGLRSNMSREALREAILNEKYIEMAFEGKRFRSEEHTSELQSREKLVCRLLLE